MKRSRRIVLRPTAAPAASTLILLAALAGATSARAAGASGSLGLASDYRYRGYSLSDERPVVNLDIAGDFSNGIYLGASALGVWTSHSGFRALGLQEYAGYARRLAPDLTGEIGVTNANYTEAYLGGSAARNTELYLGLAGRGVSGRLFYSPNYFNLGYPTLYGELNGVARLRAGWRLTGHMGLLTRTNGSERVHYDWRLGVAKEIKALTLEAAVTGAGGGDRENERVRPGEAALVSLSWAF